MTTTDAGIVAEDRVAVASSWRLMWWRFRRHHLAMASAGLLIFLYAIVLVPNFFSTQDPEQTNARQAFIPVQTVHLFDGGTFAPWVPAIVGKRNPVTLRMEWATDAQRKVSVRFFARGYSYRVLGLFESNLHLIASADPAQRIFLLGSDRLGRDQWSRIMHGTQTSMTVGLVAVALSVILGVVLGGISGYVGGRTDQVIQRLIELLQSVPTIPIWLALSAALPRDWTPIQVFFAITVILFAAASSLSARRISCWPHVSPAARACASSFATWYRPSSAISSPPAHLPSR
jgi:peptide/nickel transport system permease protein